SFFHPVPLSKSSPSIAEKYKVRRCTFVDVSREGSRAPVPLSLRSSCPSRKMVLSGACSHHSASRASHDSLHTTVMFNHKYSIHFDKANRGQEFLLTHWVRSKKSNCTRLNQHLALIIDLLSYSKNWVAFLNLYALNFRFKAFKLC